MKPEHVVDELWRDYVDHVSTQQGHSGDTTKPPATEKPESKPVIFTEPIQFNSNPPHGSVDMKRCKYK